MKLGTTLFLKIVVIIIGIPVLALCLLWIPFAVDYFNYLIIAGMYITAISFFYALYQALKLLNYIDKNKAFSELSVNALKNIKYCAIIISSSYIALEPLLYPIADKDDAPGIVAIPLIIIFASSVVAVFAAVLEKLLKEAIDIKSENDLTV